MLHPPARLRRVFRCQAQRELRTHADIVEESVLYGMLDPGVTEVRGAATCLALSALAAWVSRPFTRTRLCTCANPAAAPWMFLFRTMFCLWQGNMWVEGGGGRFREWVLPLPLCVCAGH